MKSFAAKRSHKERGMTIVEIVVVLIILVVVAGVLLPRVFGGASAAKARVNGIKMTEVKNLIQQYQLAYNSLPPSLEAIVRCPADLAGCSPMTTDEKSLVDVWDTPFVYQVDGGARTYRLTSLGEDKREGGSGVAADVTITGP